METFFDYLDSLSFISFTKIILLQLIMLFLRVYLNVFFAFISVMNEPKKIEFC
jgi:hypothetical protein